MKAPKFIYIDESKIGELGILNDAIVPENRIQESDIKYLRKDAAAQTIRDYLENWLDPYKIERLIDKIDEI